jgi:hypothetical protein
MFGGVFGNSTKSEEPTVEDRPKMSFALCREDSLYVSIRMLAESRFIELHQCRLEHQQ